MWAVGGFARLITPPTSGMLDRISIIIRDEYIVTGHRYSDALWPDRRGRDSRELMSSPIKITDDGSGERCKGGRNVPEPVSINLDTRG